MSAPPTRLTLSQQLTQFQQDHPILSLLGFTGGVVIAKKEYDRRYRGKKEKDDG